jgi:hypothetical protein
MSRIARLYRFSASTPAFSLDFIHSDPVNCLGEIASDPGARPFFGARAPKSRTTVGELRHRARLEIVAYFADGPRSLNNDMFLKMNTWVPSAE